MIFVLLVTLGLAWVTAQAGLSLALGAFLAGMLISETEYRYQVADYIKPFRDVLLGLFFVTIGMLLDWRQLGGHFVAVPVAFALMLLAKFATIFGLARLFGNARPTALRTALALAPAGEFAFVLLALAMRSDAPDAGLLQVVLAAALLSMLAAPLILARMERIVLYFVESEWTSRAVALHELAVKSMATRGHVIVCGYGRSGQALARFLESEKISVIALDSDPGARARGGRRRRIGGLRRCGAPRGAGGGGALPGGGGGGELLPTRPRRSASSPTCASCAPRCRWSCARWTTATWRPSRPRVPPRSWPRWSKARSCSPRRP